MTAPQTAVENYLSSVVIDERHIARHAEELVRIVQTGLAEDTSRPVDLVHVAKAIAPVAQTEDPNFMVAALSMQIQLAIAQDTRRQADAFKEITSELHRIRRALEKR